MNNQRAVELEQRIHALEAVVRLQAVVLGSCFAQVDEGGRKAQQKWVSDLHADVRRCVTAVSPIEAEYMDALMYSSIVALAPTLADARDVPQR
jgi:hypothetical protein